MPKTPIDYSKIHVYKLVCKDLHIKDCYIGHTTDFTKRKNYHKSTCSNERNENFNMPVYQFIRNNGGYWDMILMQTKQRENALEAKQNERIFIEELQASLNQKRPITTLEEYKEYELNWHNENKDRISATKREQYQANREEQLAKCKKYYHDNIEERRQTRNRLSNCICGETFTHASKTRHERTNKHQNYLASLKPVDD